MKYIDFSKVKPIELISGEDIEETEQLKLLFCRARDYIKSFKWCTDINKSYFGLGVADIVGVFLFEIQPESSSIDSTLWVIVGDIPSAYIVVDDAPNPACALDAYIGEMEQWVNAVMVGKSTKDFIPVNAPATKEVAMHLEKKLSFLYKKYFLYIKMILCRA